MCLLDMKTATTLEHSFMPTQPCPSQATTHPGYDETSRSPSIPGFPPGHDSWRDQLPLLLDGP